VFWNNNPWEQPPSQRAFWARSLNLPLFDPQKHEILYYIGCTTSYDRRAQKIAVALVQLFSAAGVQFGVLGDDEPCSGEEVLSVGHKPFFEEIAQRTEKIFQEKGIAKLVTTSPHAYDVFKNHYLNNHSFTPLHYTQYLVELIDENRLTFTNSLRYKVTYQDPCYLARHNKEIIEPRRILKALPGVEFIEMENHGADTFCCGGGGGRMWSETPLEERFGRLRVQQAVDTGADVLVTACPYCISCLEDGIRAQDAHNLIVMDLAELAVLAISSH
jgi:Fe-S oxidoreductase